MDKLGSNFKIFHCAGPLFIAKLI